MVITPAVMVGLLALFVSHGISFVYHYFYKGEYVRAKVDYLMVQPYSRIMVMHVAIIAGGALSQAMGSPIGLLLILIILKTILDITLHLRQHKGAKE
jgi:uncharacterized membrane protein AbrB (regulator of aidB expression)